MHDQTAIVRSAEGDAVRDKAKEELIIALQDIQLTEAKTKDFASILHGLEANDKKVVVVINERDENIMLSARNLANTKVVLANSLNTYDILNCSNLIVTESSFKTIESTLLK